MSKEALKLAILEYEKDLETDKNNQWVKNVLKGLKECEQDLERLEKLEKDHEKLKERYKHRAETSNDLCKEVKQYEKAIEIFREICSLNNNKTLETERCFLRLTEEEYELMKEVLENERKEFKN